MELLEKTDFIKTLSKEHGFLLAGIAQVRKLEEEENRLDDWLSKGYHGDMQYMANHKEMRLDPGKLVSGAKSVISLAYNYYSAHPWQKGKPNISIYALGHDYHRVLKKKLKELWKEIQSKLAPSSKGRYFVDSAPVMERQWAMLAGLGWTGKNTLLINPKHGSYFFLAEIICDIELKPDTPMHDYCGTCTRCIDACPTQAIDANGYVLKADQCISYLTIETKKSIPDEFSSSLNDYVFGCDICQDICPWNRFSKPHNDPAFDPQSDFLSWTKQDWDRLDQETFDKTFGHSPVKRAGYAKIKDTISKI